MRESMLFILITVALAMITATLIVCDDRRIEDMEEIRGRITKLEDQCTKLYKSVELLQRKNERLKSTQDIILTNQGVIYLNQKAFNVRISALEARRPIRTLPQGE